MKKEYILLKNSKAQPTYYSSQAPTICRDDGANFIGKVWSECQKIPGFTFHRRVRILSKLVSSTIELDIQ